MDRDHLQGTQLIERREGEWRHAGWPRVLRRDSEGSPGIGYTALERKPKAVKSHQKAEKNSKLVGYLELGLYSFAIHQLVHSKEH